MIQILAFKYFQFLNILLTYTPEQPFIGYLPTWDNQNNFYWSKPTILYVNQEFKTNSLLLAFELKALKNNAPKKENHELQKVNSVNLDLKIILTKKEVVNLMNP